MNKDMNNKELENLMIKYKKYEIEEDELLDGFKKIKDQIKIVRIFRITDGGIKDGVLTKGTKLIEVLWATDKGYNKLCYTSFEKSSANKPNFQTLAVPDDFINIVKDCVRDKQSLAINVKDETSLTLPIKVLKGFID